MATYREGCTDKAVVQEIQRAVGCYPDGIWGPLTTEALKTWQREHGLVADGIAGPKTLAKMGEQQQGNTAGGKVVLGSGGVTLTHKGVTVRLKKSRRQITDLVVHCTATPEGQDMTVAQIRASHKKQGWSDIGYHYVIYRDGSINLGRDVDISGAHVSGYNAHSIGIVYVGGLENRPGVAYAKLQAKDTRTTAQRDALRSLLEALRLLYPKARIRGHRDFSPDKNGNGIIEPKEWIKACPSFPAIDEYRDI